QAEATQQLVDHPSGGGLAVGAGEMDGTVAALRLAEHVHQPVDAVPGRSDLRLTPAREQLRLHLLPAPSVSLPGGTCPGHHAGNAASAAAIRSSSALALALRSWIELTTSGLALARKLGLPSFLPVCSSSFWAAAWSRP